MELTADQKLTYRDIQDHYIRWLNTDAFGDYHHTRDDLWPTECSLISITRIPLGFSTIEVWNLYVGFGDEGGPSILTAHVDVRKEDQSKIIFIAQHFDTASREFFRLSYVDNSEVWA